MNMELSPMWVSLKTAAAATTITFILGVAAAYRMAHFQGRLKGFLDGLLVLPLVLPPTVVGFILLVFLGKNSFIGRLLALFDVTVVFSWSAAVIASTVVSFPLMYKTARGAFEQIDRTYIDAAATLGSSPWQIFWRIVLPLSWPGVAAGTILAFARALGEFGATLMLAGSIQGRTQTIPTAIYFAVEGGNMERAAMWVILVVAISLFVVVLSNQWTAKHFTALPSAKEGKHH